MNTDLFISKYFHFPFQDILNQINHNPYHYIFDIVKAELVHKEEQSFRLTEKNITYTINTNILVGDKNKKDLLVICIKDNSNILSFCLDQLFKNQVETYCDILVIDDRSESDTNLEICKKYNVSHIAVTNTEDTFNYSVLNNIAAVYAKILDKKRMICWNSDLWPTNTETLPSLLNKHDLYESSISGTRLIYPAQEIYQNIFGKYRHVLGDTLQKSFGTIQHGGIIFVPSPSYVYKNQLMFLPSHQWRFWKSDYNLAILDTRCFAVTGAVHVLDLDTFIELGGYAVSLATSYQDIDLCLRANICNKGVYYFGSEDLIHAETITNDSTKAPKQSSGFLSDMCIYDYVWQPKMHHVLGMKK